MHWETTELVYHNAKLWTTWFFFHVWHHPTEPLLQKRACPKAHLDDDILFVARNYRRFGAILVPFSFFLLVKKRMATANAPKAQGSQVCSLQIYSHKNETKKRKWKASSWQRGGKICRHLRTNTLQSTPPRKWQATILTTGYEGVK